MSRSIVFLMFLSLFFLGLGGFAYAEKSDSVTDQSVLKQKLKEKYKAKEVRIKDNKKGLFHIAGDLTPSEFKKDKKDKSPKLSKEVRKQKALDMGKAFLRNEKDLFDAVDVDKEFKKGKMRVDSHGNIHFVYKRFVEGLELDGMTMVFHMNDDDQLFALNGELVPVSQRLKNEVKSYVASSNKPTQDEIYKKIEEDLFSSGAAYVSIDKYTLNVFAAEDEPYVVWKADVILEKPIGRWLYVFDAFNGEMLSKKSGLQF